jgi:hypothetical protein
MPKTYNTIPTTTTGSVYTAAAHNNIVTNVNNYRVPPMAKYKRDTAQTIANVTDTLIAWNSEEFTNTDGFTNSSGVITVQTAGVYSVSVGVIWGVNATGARAVTVTKNSTGVNSDAAIISSTVISAGSLTGTGINGHAIVSLAANDVLRAYAFQSSGGNLDLSASSSTLNRGATHISIAWLGQVS